MGDPFCIACSYSGVDEQLYAAYGCPACNCKPVDGVFYLIGFHGGGELHNRFRESTVFKSKLAALRELSRTNTEGLKLFEVREIANY